MFSLDSFSGGFTQTNGFLLSCEGGGHVLVDAPEGVADWIRAQGIVLDVLLLTHMHFDHVIDAARVAADHRCEVMAFAAGPSPELTMVDLLKQMGLAVDVAPFSVDTVLEGRESCEAGGIKFGLLHIPGHSPDSLCFCPGESSDVGDRIVLGGDVLFRGGIGRTDFPHSDHDRLIQGIEDKLLTLPDDTLIFPGHGPWTTIGLERAGNPFLH